MSLYCYRWEASAEFTIAATALLGGAFLLGIANPKAYLAFASLAGAFTLVAGPPFADAAAKWAICVAVMIMIDFAWLWAGAQFRRVAMRPRTERVLNIALALMIVAACAEAWL